MKKVRKKVNHNEINTLRKVEGLFPQRILTNNWSIEFECSNVKFDLDSVELTAEFEEPETLKEWLEVNNKTKQELLKWLNENYKIT